ncbi:MAG: hypothetical protein WDN28_12765 [Chthoniobacter sp.]
MNLTTSFLVLAVALALAGCASPAQTYAKQHPELTAKQLQILNTGKIPDGDAVAGMTREQIQLAMGVEPAQYTKIDGQDAWIYVTKKLSPMSLTMANDATFNRRDDRSQHSLAEGESHAPSDQPLVKTTVYFQGNQAVKADVVNGGL